jgi:polysaccharide biosynthesis PFTS motif protein
MFHSLKLIPYYVANLKKSYDSFKFLKHSTVPTEICLFYGLNSRQIEALTCNFPEFIKNLKNVPEIQRSTVLFLETNTKIKFNQADNNLYFFNTFTLYFSIFLANSKEFFVMILRDFLKYKLKNNIISVSSFKCFLLKILSNNQIKLSAVTTLSCLDKIPKDFKIFQKNTIPTIMLHYSHNVFPINIKGFAKIPNPTWLQNVKVDKHYVMSDYHAERINKVIRFGKSDSIGTFLLESSEKVNLSYNETNICVFDEMPLSDSHKIFSIDAHYYTDRRMLQFLDDCFSTLDTFRLKHFIKVNIFLKPKRNSTNIHSTNYIDQRRRILKRYNIEVVPPYNSQKDLISKSSLVIAIPYTTVPIYANALNKKSFYYDPYGDIAVNDFNPSEFEIVQGKENLEKRLADFFTNNFS